MVVHGGRFKPWFLRYLADASLWHASAIVVGFALYAYAPPYGHYNTVLPSGRAGRPIDGP